MSSKVVLANREALSAKYGSSSASVVNALTHLAAYDATIGITTTIVYVDDVALMARYNAASVTNPSDPQQHKEAVDAIASAISPDFFLIIGSPDLFPHQSLDNPLAHSTTGDTDPTVPSDLPYACTAPYSTNPADFIAPTRSISRIPDIEGSRDRGAYLVKLLTNVTGFVLPVQAFYRDYFAISAAVWLPSSQQSVKNIFGNIKALRECPPSGPPWTRAQYAKGMHFANLHGAQNDPAWYGQSGPASAPPTTYPIAMNSVDIAGQQLKGNVCAVEACYGAQLFDPAAVGTPVPLCNAYLGSGCVAFFGSSTISYGSDTANLYADLLTQYFLINILSGDSVGNACLAARQQYVHAHPTPSPLDLKTLAQFMAFGDASLAPVGSSGTQVIFGDAMGIELDRMNRGAILRAAGDRLTLAVPTPRRLRGVASASARGLIADVTGRYQLTSKKTTSYNFELPINSRRDFISTSGIDGLVLHVTSGTIKGGTRKFPATVIFEVYEKNGQLMNVRTAWRH